MMQPATAVDVVRCPERSGPGEWVRTRDGFAVDSGSAALVMPTKWLHGIAANPWQASKRGQTFAGALTISRATKDSDNLFSSPARVKDDR